jgi:hypothetical protein
MNNSKMVTGAAALVALIAVAGIAGASFAYQGNPDIKGPEYSAERHEAMEEAMESSDYETWQDLMTNKGRVTQVVNKDNFDKFVKAHDLTEEGDLEGARAIREELGLNQGFKKGGLYKGERGMGSIKGGEMRDVLENGDYEKWKELMEDKPTCPRGLENGMADLELTEDNFNKLIESHNLMKTGDFEGAQEIRSELGLDQAFRGVGKNKKVSGCGSCPFNSSN